MKPNYSFYKRFW